MERGTAGAVDPWGRPTITTPPRLPAWVPAPARRAIKAGLADGLHRFDGTAPWGDVWVWIDRRGGRTELQLHQDFPESEEFYRSIGVEDADARRRLSEASEAYNRDLRHLMVGRELSPEDARQELHRINDEVFLLTVEAAALLGGSPARLVPLRPAPKSAVIRRTSEAASAGERGIFTGGQRALAQREAPLPGGAWPAMEPRVDAAAIAQRDALSCGPACGQMLLRDRGVRATQELVGAKAGGIPATPSGLERALNVLDDSCSGHWAGGLVRLPGRPAPDVVHTLGSTGSWSAFLWERGARIAHAVVVDGVDANGRVWIRDPWGPGTRYSMELDDFLDHWTGIAVYRRPR